MSRRAFERLGEQKARAEGLLLAADKAKLSDAYRDADNVLGQAIAHEQDMVGSTRFFGRGDAALEAVVSSLIKGLGEMRAAYGKGLEQFYKNRCQKEGVAPAKLAPPTADEVRAAKSMPVRTEKMRGPFDAQGFAAALKNVKDAPAYLLGRSEGLVRNYLDGKRSILDIRNAIAAEMAGRTGAAPALKDIESYVRALELTGFVTIKR